MAVLVLAAACSGGSDPSDTTPSSTTVPASVAPVPDTAVAPTTTVDPGPRVGGSLTVLLAQDPTPITGWAPWDDVCAWACRNVLDQVLETLSVVLPDGSVAPWLAESIESDVSLRLWTVKLRPNILFTDGTALTAAVVKEGIDNYLKSGDASSGHFRDARLVTVQVADELTLVFDLSEPNGGFAASLAGPIGRVFSVAAADIDEDRFAAAPVGTGAFMFSNWSPGQPAVLQANPDYWMTDADGAALPYLSQLTFVQVADEAERLAQLRAGTGQVMQTRVPDTIEKAAAEPDGTDSSGTGSSDTEPDSAEPAGTESSEARLNVVRQIDDNIGAIAFNTLRSPFDDVRVRRGLALAVDQQVLVDTVNTDVQPATQWWSPASIWHSQLVAAQWPTQDTAAAANLLGEYVADADRSDGRGRGEPIQVRIQCTDDASLVALLAELKMQLEATGLVEVIAETVSRTGLIQRVIGSVTNSPSFSGDFTATCWRLGGESDPWVLLDAALGPTRTSPLNIANFHTENLTALVDALQGSEALAPRRAALEQIMLMFATEVPFLYLGHAASAVIALPQVQGLEQWSLPPAESDELAESSERARQVVQGQRLGVGRYAELWLLSG